MADFLLRAGLGGIGVALVAAPAGCFVVWRRMVFFGAALAHSALLGVALGLILGIDVTLGALIICVLVALSMALIARDHRLADDTFLGIISHAALALALVVVASSGGLRVELLSFLFGDILAVSLSDLVWIWGGGAIVLAVLAVLWKPLLAMTVHEDLAAVEGVPVTIVRIAFLLVVALVTAVALKIVGALLIVALLIVPAATARRFAVTPESMAALAAAIGVVSVLAGLAASVWWDAPAGPAIVLAASALFAFTLPVPRLLRLRR
jgi:zinc transport system permease protein